MATDASTRQVDTAQSPPPDSSSEILHPLAQDSSAESASHDGAPPDTVEIEPDIHSSDESAPSIRGAPGTGRLEAGTIIATSPVWKAHHQDYYES